MKIIGLLFMMAFLLPCSVYGQEYCRDILKQSKSALLHDSLEKAIEKLQDTEICDHKNVLLTERQAVQNAIFKAMKEQKERAVKAQKQANASAREAITARKQADTLAKKANLYLAQLFEEKTTVALDKFNYDEAWLYNQEALQQIASTSHTLPLTLGRLFLQEILPSHTSPSNALDFDGEDDEIEVPNASRLIANKPLSISLWVFPQNPQPGWPDFDGLAGFRNDNNADFYLLQLGLKSVEARFRNSTGEAFTIQTDSLRDSTWNHLVLTYNGKLLSLYHNAILVGSTPAHGFITSTNSPLNIGFIPYPYSNFYLNGRLDDVCLWSKCLSGEEVTGLFNACKVDPSASELQLCYEFDQGVAKGDNSAITTAVEMNGKLEVIMNNFDLTGNESNFVNHSHTGSRTTACYDPYLYAGASTPKMVLTGKNENIAAIAFDSNGTFSALISGNTPTRLSIFQSASTLDSLVRTDNTLELSGISGSAFSKNGKLATIHNIDTTYLLQQWDLRSHDISYIPTPVVLAGNSTSLALSPDGRTLAIGQADGRIVFRSDVDIPPTDIPAMSTNAVSALGFSPDGKQVASGYTNGVVAVWPVSQEKTPKMLSQISRFKGAVKHLAFSPDGRYLAIAGATDTVIQYSLADGITFQDPAESKGDIPVTCLAYNLTGDVLATGDQKGNIVLWGRKSPAEMHQLAVIQGHVKAVTGLAFHPTGHTLISCAANGNIRTMSLSLRPFDLPQKYEIDLLAFVSRFHDADQQAKRKLIYDATIKKLSYFKFVSKG